MANRINSGIFSDLTKVDNLPIFGFEYKERWRREEPFSGPPQNGIRIFNHIRASGYIPYVNVIVGIALLIASVFYYILGTKGITKEDLTRLAIRGCLTIAFGYWLVAADIAKYVLQENALKSAPVKYLI